MQKNSLINPICTIRTCSEPARFNFVTVGQPNGDVAVSYCGFHIDMCGVWHDCPVPYSATVTGPFGGTK